jgi:tetratricopeptide (TPR) repeat protein
VLNYEGDQGQKALDDLNRILPLEPNNSSLLDLAGEVYLELNRPADALKALSAALRLDPNSRQILIHYARALERDGQTQQAMAVLQKFQKIPPSSPRPYSGLFKYLSLPVAKQQQQYVANLERNSQMNPQDMILRYRLGRAYLLQGKISEAKQSFAVVLESSSDARLLGKCGAALVSAGDYLEARPFLEKAVEADPGNTGARLDLAIAQFHSAGAQQALSILDGTPLNARQGDYYLLRAQILDAKGKPAEAAQDLNRGLAAQPTRPDLYFAGVLFLVKHGQLNQAISFLQKAVESLPDSPQLLLAETITYGLAQQFEAAKKVLSEIETKWPEWDEPYLIHGFILVGQAKMPEAKPLLETAIALGARDPLAYYNLALVDMESFPPQVEEAKKAIEKALQADPNDAYIQSLAGKIAYEQKDYPASIEHLSEAIRLWPNMVEAHQTLSAAYRALGEKDKSVAELKEVLHIKQQIRAPDQAPPSPIENLLFSVPSALPPAIPSGLQSKGLPKAP